MPRRVSSGPLTMTLSLADTHLPQGGTISGEILIEVTGKEAFHFRALLLDFDGTESNSIKDDQGEFDAFLNDLTSTRTYLHRRATPAGERDAEREDAEAAEQLRLELLFREHHTAPYARVVPWKPPKPTKKSDAKPPPAAAAVAAEPMTSVAPSSQSPPTPPLFSPQEGPDVTIATSTHVVSDEPVAESGDGAEPPGAAGLHSEQEGSYGSLVQDRFYPGRYSFPFNFTIPPWMPPSLYYRVSHIAYGEIRYSVTVTLDIPGATPNLHLEEPFFVLSTLSKRQLLGARQEAVDTATISPLPPLSAQFQVFHCEFLGNFCCVDDASEVEVEVALQCSRAMLLRDPHSRVDQVLLEEATHRGGRVVAQTVMKGYDAFAQRRSSGLVQRRPPASGEAASADKEHPSPPPQGNDDNVASPQDEDRKAERQRILKALPAPVGTLPLVVRVDNRCPKREISRVRVELVEILRLFKALEPPHTFPHPLARFDYNTSIPPLHEATFPVALQLPTQFRRCREDPDTLLPPPGVRTANFVTQTLIVVSFPGLNVYTQEEDWTVGAVHLAEALDMTDSVLELPVSYS